VQVSVWNWRKFSKKTGSGFMGSAEIPLDFLHDLARTRSQKCDSYTLSTTAHDSTGNIFISFELGGRPGGGAPTAGVNAASTARVPSTLGQPAKRSASISVAQYSLSLSLSLHLLRCTFSGGGRHVRSSDGHSFIGFRQSHFCSRSIWDHTIAVLVA